MTEQLSRERLEEKLLEHIKQGGDSEEETMIRMLLAGMDNEPVILYRERNPYNGMSTGWIELTQDEFDFIKENAGENAEFKTVYTAPPAPAPVAEPDFARLDSLAGEFLNNAMSHNAKVRDAYTWCAHRLAETVRDARAAMLKAGPEKQKVTLREGIQALRDLGGIDAEKILAERDSLNGADACWCHTCRPVTITDMRFVVCPDCGNKRCPRANDHRKACSGSNEPGQVGSAYPTEPVFGNFRENENSSTNCPCCGRKPLKNKACSVSGCDGKHVARGFCMKHYAIERKKEPSRRESIRSADKRYRARKAAAPEQEV